MPKSRLSQIAAHLPGRTDNEINNPWKFDDESQEDEEYEEDDDEENVPSPSTALVVIVAVPGSSIFNGGGGAPISKPTATIVLADSSDPKWCRLELIEEKKPPSPPLDDSRRLFQWL
ncbi:hypothetical protein JHK87_040341 [Glycine soja]|nr:hypothetical protein JHK87_040341 [Glycine soja]